jgi:predicted kinase
LFHSDERRKRLSGVPAQSRAGRAWGQGLYVLESRQATYRSLLGDATRTLAAGRSAIVDATFTRREFRRSFVDAAERMKIPYCFLNVGASETVVRERMARRAREGGASDADFDVYLREREAFEPPDEVPAGHVVAVDSSEDTPEDCASKLLDALIGIERRK